ncbi:metallophosphoesterase [Streptomyces cellulosae]|uniref:metallophosphoesterase n=1 Tax=Streptomyces cellulosae TaxID=1968 RepID=UPI000ABB70F0|nr:metallophosphoesterase [Streptomyces cellulosae]MCX4480290.1 metallophosphoesterase [Streptomyces cellulosae]MCX4482291.1 metallophosphoesterase [Streptomyces cellulosae]WTB86765.1 metallophosphoesterase [Streptomyces cellulosae]WTB92861.1 metallophosphoesterase [Streptomyces cellulosae]
MVTALLTFALYTGASALVHWYLWRRLIQDTALGARTARYGARVLAVLAVLPPLAMATTRDLPQHIGRWIAWPGYVWLALMMYVTITVLLAEPLRLLVARRGTSRRISGGARAEALPQKVSAGVPESGRRTPQRDMPGGEGERLTEGRAPSDGPTRRVVLARATAITAGAVATSLVGHGMHTALGSPRLAHVRVPLARLGRRADGFRIAVVSDIHLGPILGERHTERIVEIVNRAAPDAVAIVGDLVDGGVEHLGRAAAPLRHLTSRHGSYFVTGNHEYKSGAEPWIEEISELGIRVLRNERLELPAFDLAGVNDLTGTDHGDGPDYEAALSDRAPERAVVLLAHQPVMVHEAARRGVDLQLSGHTHGGQMAPLGLLASLQQPAIAGLHEIDGTQLYVSRGTGFWGPPVRVGAPPDITVVELQSRNR